MSIERLNIIWPEWRVEKQLGEGSFGKVYKVIREGHGVTSTAAIKVLSIPQSDSPFEGIETGILSITLN